jgi:hypothetical protein
MKNIALKQPLLKLLMSFMLCIVVSGFIPNMGLDRYEIYLNDKLVLKQHVNAPLNLKKLALNGARGSDHLRIFYTHCTNKGIGTNRSIVVKAAGGDVLKKWVFKDVEKGMDIAVKELLQVEKQHSDKILSLHYEAQELSDGEMLLASVRFD